MPMFKIVTHECPETREHKTARSLAERIQKFQYDGSCTEKCSWGYGVVIDTGLCIALDECRQEFANRGS